MRGADRQPERRQTLRIAVGATSGFIRAVSRCAPEPPRGLESRHGLRQFAASLHEHQRQPQREDQTRTITLTKPIE